MQPPQMEVAIAVLSRLLKTGAGKAMLPSAMPYLDAALQSPLLALRRLATQQYSCLLQGGGSVAVEPKQHAAGKLLEALQDRDTGVALEAEAGISAWAAADTGAAKALFLLPSDTAPSGSGGQGPSPGSFPPLSCPNVATLAAATGNSILRMRLLSLLVASAVRGGPDVAAVIKQSGERSLPWARGDMCGIEHGRDVGFIVRCSITLFLSVGLTQQLLSRELSAAAKDPLSALSALNTVSELSARHHGMAGQMSAAVSGALPQLLADPMLRPGALRVAALLLKEALEERRGVTPMDIDGGVTVYSLKAANSPNARDCSCPTSPLCPQVRSPRPKRIRTVAR